MNYYFNTVIEAIQLRLTGNLDYNSYFVAINRQHNLGGKKRDVWRFTKSKEQNRHEQSYPSHLLVRMLWFLVIYSILLPQTFTKYFFLIINIIIIYKNINLFITKT